MIEIPAAALAVQLLAKSWIFFPSAPMT